MALQTNSCSLINVGKEERDVHLRPLKQASDSSLAMSIDHLNGVFQSKRVEHQRVIGKVELSSAVIFLLLAGSEAHAGMYIRYEIVCNCRDLPMWLGPLCTRDRQHHNPPGALSNLLYLR